MSEEPTQDPRQKAEAFTATLQHNPEPEEADHHVSGKPKGVINARVVRAVFFVVFSIGLFVTATICILAVWSYAGGDTAQRAVTTLAIVTVSLGLFTLANEALAGKVTL